MTTKLTKASPSTKLINDKDIFFVKTYQSVHFEGRQETTFLGTPQPGKKHNEIEVLESIGLISVKGARDHILIPLTNIAHISMNSELRQINTIKLEESQKPKKAQTISRPR